MNRTIVLTASFKKTARATEKQAICHVFKCLKTVKRVERFSRIKGGRDAGRPCFDPKGDNFFIHFHHDVIEGHKIRCLLVLNKIEAIQRVETTEEERIPVLRLIKNEEERSSGTKANASVVIARILMPSVVRNSAIYRGKANESCLRLVYDIHW